MSSVGDRWLGWKNKKLEEHNISEEHLHFAINHTFDFIEMAIMNPTMPVIVMENLGTFKPTLSMINASIRYRMRWYRSGNKSREEIVDDLKRLWPIRNRLINEALGEFTSRNWNQYFLASDGDYINFIKNEYTTERKWVEYKLDDKNNKKFKLN